MRISALIIKPELTRVMLIFFQTSVRPSRGENGSVCTSRTLLCACLSCFLLSVMVASNGTAEEKEVVALVREK